MEIRIADMEDMPLVFELRHEVFVCEQNVPIELERDNEDAAAIHIIAKDNCVTTGCARILLHGDEAHIGRLAVKREMRGKGIGAQICRFIIDSCRALGCRKIVLHSQLHAVEFYKKLGFSAYGDKFLEAGIIHVKMRYEI